MKTCDWTKMNNNPNKNQRCTRRVWDFNYDK